MTKRWGPKDPDAVRDFGINWAPDLGTLTIAGSTWLLDGETWAGDADLVKEASSFTDTTTTVRISGGILGTTYVVTNHVVLSDDQEDDFSQRLKIKQR